MHGFRHSILKRWHSLTLTPASAARNWLPPYWQQQEDVRDIACHRCRKFDPERQKCSVPFGTPLRKCVVAAIEAHFHDVGREDVLEIGFGRFALARNLVRRSGGRWTGIDPAQPASRVPALGRGGHGHAAAIPFPDATFDLVYGIQTFEHWGQRSAAGRPPSDYAACMTEIHRVLKPGGKLYLDAPMHFHGHEMFIMGDLARIRSVFDPGLWDAVVVERWRFHHEPLPAYPPTARAQQDWLAEILSYAAADVERVRRCASVWLATFTTRKRL